MKKKLPSLIRVGEFRLGWRWVQLEVDTTKSDGAGWFAPDSPKICVIRVGISGPWPMTVATLLHEAFEIAASDLMLRYAPVGALSSSTAMNLMVMTHCQFSEITDRAGDFMANVLPDLRKAWNLQHKGE